MMGWLRRGGRPRRVLIIVENLPVPFDRRVWQEARALRHHGYEVSVICPKGSGHTRSHEVLDGVHIYRYPLPLEARSTAGYLLEYGAALLFQFVLAWRVFFTRGFDVVHACNPPDTIFIVGAVFKALGRRFIFDHHDLSPELYIAKGGRPGAMHRLLLLLERLTFRLADTTIATNDSYRRVAIERGGRHPDNVFVVRSGPDLSRIMRQPPSPELLRGKEHLVAYLGVMGSQEGIPYLLEAARHIVRERRRSDVHFTLVGGGPELDALRAQASAMGLDDVLDFTGRVPDAELLAVLNTAAVCVNADEFNEMNDKSTMNKVLEYMALGKPVVQFDLTEGRVSAGDASLYARRNDARDLGDRIVELLDDPARREEMGRIGRERIERDLSWEHQVPALLAAYESAFRPRGASARRDAARARK